jgi:hypothetical protein
MTGKSIYFKNEHTVGEFKEATEIDLNGDWPSISWIYLIDRGFWYRTANNTDGTPAGWQRCFSEEDIQPPDNLKLQVLLLKGSS